MSLKSKDGDNIDVFLGPDPTSETVFVIDQLKAPDFKEFDEHKVVIGARSPAEAKAIYQRNYQSGWKGLGKMVAMPMKGFKYWLKHGKTDQPASEFYQPIACSATNFDERTLPTESHNLSESLPESMDEPMSSLKLAEEENTEEQNEHRKAVRNYELPTREEWAAARKIIPDPLLAQIELGIEQLNLGKSGPQIVGIPGTYAGDVAGIHVAVVDGDWIKLHQNPDMVEGDNCLHSQGIVPKGWAYVDRNVYKHDRDPIAMHEITETLLEQAGWDYEKAHRSANQFEDDRRKKLGIGMSNECEQELALAEPLPEGEESMNSLFDKKIRELPITNPEHRAAADSVLGKNHMGYIAKSIHNAGFRGQNLEDHTNSIAADLLSPGGLFDSYDESKGATYPTLFKTYVRNGVFGLQRNRKYQNKYGRQDTAEKKADSPLVNAPEEQRTRPGTAKFNKERGTEHFDYRSPKEERFVNALKEHVGKHLGELGVKFLEAKLAGKKYKDVDIGNAPAWTVKKLPPKLHESIRSFAEAQDNAHLNWLLDRLNREKGMELDNEQDPTELGLAGTISDVLAARGLAAPITPARVVRPHKPTPARQGNSGPVKAVLTASTRQRPATGKPSLPLAEDEEDLSLSEPPGKMGETYYHSHGHGVPLHEHRLALPPGMAARPVRRPVVNRRAEERALSQYEDLRHGIEDL